MVRPTSCLVALWAGAILLAACGESSRPAGPRAMEAAPRPRCGGCHAHEEARWAASPHALHAVPATTPPPGAVAAVGARWMQVYLRPDPDGSHRIHPQGFDRRRRAWVPLHDVLVEIAGRDADVVPPTIPDLAGRTFDLDCSGCHASGTRTRHDTVAGRVVTTWRDLAIDCEACHGDASRHAEGRPHTIDRLQDLSPRGQVMVCGRCHGGPPTSGDLAPGEAASFLPVLGDRPGTFADGAAGGQQYQVAAFARSPCFVRGGLTCTGCHDAHGPGLVGDGTIDDVCLRCHTGYATREHTHHDPTREGARCVACHLPRLLTGLLAHQRDHRIASPVPGIPGTRDACTACHADLTPGRLLESWRAWYGEVPAAALEGTRSVLAARSGGPGAAAALRAGATHPDPFVRATVLTAAPDLALGARDPSPEVRFAALRAAPTATRVQDLAPFLADPEPWIRGEAAVALARRGAPVPPGHAADVETLARGMRHHADARWLLATWCLDEGRASDALPWLEEALALRPDATHLWFLAAEVQRIRRKPEASEAALGRGIDRVVAAVRRGEPADQALEAFVAAQVARGRHVLAREVAELAAQRLPTAAQRERFAAIAARRRGGR